MKSILLGAIVVVAASVGAVVAMGMISKKLDDLVSNDDDDAMLSCGDIFCEDCDCQCCEFCPCEEKSDDEAADKTASEDNAE